ncbi:MAG: 50S ribosomal protein L14e [Candidatus Brockarchaeota archaeon]|nr:50S ribosomal protein L14e [Candidatus Brockarchaeota archaeon]
MPAFSVGRICVKKRGREKGLRCVIVDEIDENYVLVTGPKKLSGVRRRRVNVDHLAPTEKAVRIRRGASDQDVLAALTRANLTSFLSGLPETPKSQEGEVPGNPSK